MRREFLLGHEKRVAAHSLVRCNSPLSCPFSYLMQLEQGV